MSLGLGARLGLVSQTIRAESFLRKLFAIVICAAIISRADTADIAGADTLFQYSADSAPSRPRILF